MYCEDLILLFKSFDKAVIVYIQQLFYSIRKVIERCIEEQIVFSVIHLYICVSASVHVCACTLHSRSVVP